MRCARISNTLRASFFPDDVVPSGWIEVDISSFEDYGELAEGYSEGKYIIIDDKMVFNPEYDKMALKRAKEAKYNEALQGAWDYINNEAVYQFDENNSIEATDGNIGKFTGYALDFLTGSTEPKTWTSKEDNVLTLDAQDVARILNGLGAVQTEVWTVKFVNYKNRIERARTVKTVNSIVIDYSE